MGEGNAGFLFDNDYVHVQGPGGKGYFGLDFYLSRWGVG